MISTKNLSQFANPVVLQAAMQKNAILDVIMCQEDWLRCHSFDPRWSKGVAMGNFDNGGGNHLFAFFSNSGCIIKGFDHESPVSPHAQDKFQVWPGIYDGVPSHLLKMLEDEAVEKEEVTFCIWTAEGNDSWMTSAIRFPNGEDDGSSYLLGVLFTAGEEYWKWAQSYYEREIDRDAVQAIYDRKSVTNELVHRMNPGRSTTEVYTELQTILGAPQ